MLMGNPLQWANQHEQQHVDLIQRLCAHFLPTYVTNLLQKSQQPQTFANAIWQLKKWRKQGPPEKKPKNNYNNKDKEITKNVAWNWSNDSSKHINNGNACDSDSLAIAVTLMLLQQQQLPLARQNKHGAGTNGNGSDCNNGVATPNGTAIKWSCIMLSLPFGFSNGSDGVAKNWLRAAVVPSGKNYCRKN